MRWFVEVSRVGDSTPAERYCLDAKAWQAALQETRKLRGDSGPLSKFSIELLDDGYRAVDPIQKIRYLVSHAPADAELLAPTTVNGARETSRPSASRPSASPGPSAPPAPTQSTAPQAPSGFAAAEIGSSPGALALALRKSAPPTPVAARSSTAAPAAIESIVPRPSAAPKNPGLSAPRPSPKTAGVSVAPPSATAPVASATALQVANFQAPQPSTAPNVAMKPAPVLSVLPEPARPIEVLPPQRATEAKDVGHAPNLPDFEVVLSRKQTPTKDTPISYRELAYAVPQGTQRADVELLLLERLEFCRQELSAQPAGKLVQIAVFDHVFTQRPLRAPLGTLAWKDWRGAAVLAYPAFGEPSPPVTDSLPPPPPPSESEELETAPVSRGGEEAQPIPLAKPITHAPRPDPNETPPLPAALKSAPIPAAAIVPLAPQATTSAVVSPSSPVVSDAETPVPEVAIVLPIAAQPASAAAPAEAAVEVAAPPEVLAPPPAAAFAAPPPAAATTSESPSTPPEASTRRSSQPPAVSEHRSSRPRLFTGVRRPGEDLISDLFERMHELHFERDIPRGVEFAINATLEVLPCAITMVQVFDINTRQFVVVRARGEGASRAVLHRTPDSDPLIVEVMRRGRTRTYNAEQDKRFTQGRWSHLQRPPKQVLCAPVRQGGRYLGLLELADPQGGAPFHVTEINAVDYICEQLADFIANRPIVLDSDVILPK